MQPDAIRLSINMRTIFIFKCRKGRVGSDEANDNDVEPVQAGPNAPLLRRNTHAYQKKFVQCEAIQSARTVNASELQGVGDL